MNRQGRVKRIKPIRRGRHRIVACACQKHEMGKPAARQRAAQLSKETGETWEAYKCPARSDVWHIGHPGIPVGPTGTREALRAALEAKQARLARQARP